MTKLHLFLLATTLFTIQSCATRATAQKTVSTSAKINTETLEFISYLDDGDYSLFLTKKGEETLYFINENNEDRSLLRGDQIELRWKEDTIWIAGEGDEQEMANWVVSVKKVKDGKVSQFRKEYGKELKFYFAEEYDFSTSFMDELYLLVEYYVANSNNSLLQLNLKNKADLIYSIEKQNREEKEYIVIGLATEFENHTRILQWLYYDNEAEYSTLYEYDLANDELIEFQ